MKYNFLIKATPFLSTLLIIFLLCFSNQKEKTKLRFLIWNTPSLALGTYIAISTGSGFILSYLINTNIAKFNQKSPTQSLRFKDEDDYHENKDFIETNTNLSYDNTLIERDIKDPSPTVNASFRIIGRNEKSNINFKNNTNNSQYDNSFEFEEESYKQPDENQTTNQVKSISNDWNDESYSRW